MDHLQYLLDIHENNAIVLYSDMLSKQIPKSYAANAFNVVREAMHQIEVVRICALWDPRHTIERESIMTVIELIDHPNVLDALANQARADHFMKLRNDFFHLFRRFNEFNLDGQVLRQTQDPGCMHFMIRTESGNSCDAPLRQKDGEAGQSGYRQT